MNMLTFVGATGGSALFIGTNTRNGAKGVTLLLELMYTLASLT